MTWTMTAWTKQMMKPSDPDKQRGTEYADGGVSDLRVYHPDPDKIKQFHQEWDWLPEHEEWEM